MFRGWLVRIAGLFRRERRLQQFEQELESNLQLHIEENMFARMSRKSR